MSPKILSRILSQELITDKPYTAKYQVAILPVGTTFDWNSQVVGVLITDLTDRQLYLLDIYEGEEYDRQMVPITVGSQQVPGWTYVWKDEADYLKLDEDWEEEVFMQSSNIDAFLRKELQEMRRQLSE
ncbi:hypothetical protein BJ684DRAFT_20958 [Piptocephalis cylindrospora]|uniref:Putative gamma-glutamylcyclotransferase n=1 Tax=Piptocephalis cylindrospora TaxID=1907219 RepID=A0A4P9Y1U1_9FUNG|nr:hypothetical protein BJ684DRAFT_20958 [Piptocephalis cylindrospora]|eukprot:RKP12512.1 hypothetical protein BJ684DRAFT_20958 [Piptocephalis cylindrospora]